jgi:hypothetical protein
VDDFLISRRGELDVVGGDLFAFTSSILNQSHPALCAFRFTQRRNSSALTLRSLPIVMLGISPEAISSYALLRPIERALATSSTLSRIGPGAVAESRELTG